jgi:hypothetical protein
MLFAGCLLFTDPRALVVVVFLPDLDADITAAMASRATLVLVRISLTCLLNAT